MSCSMRISVSSVILLVLINILTLEDGTEARPQATRRLKICKLDYLLECFNEPVMYFTAQYRGTGLPTNETEYEQFCFSLHDYLPYCARRWFAKCGSPLHLEMYERAYIQPLQQSMREFCDTRGTIRSELLEHASCIIDKVKLTANYRATCFRDLLASSEFVHTEAKNLQNIGFLVQNSCCAYNQWEKCITNQINVRCGGEAAHVFPALIHNPSVKILKTLCPMDAYDPADSDKCKPENFRPPKEFVPQGYQSDSLISRYFSYICPNVGWGVDSTRDF